MTLAVLAALPGMAGGMGDPGLGPATPVPDLPSEITVSGLPGYETGLFGWTWDGDPATFSGPYPPVKPHSPAPPAVAIDSSGIIEAEGPGGTPVLAMYCTQLSESTTEGYGYDLGDWSATPNAGYVARILNDFYPNDPVRPALLTDAQRGEAVQAAIWFFTDGFVFERPTGPVDHRHLVFDAVAAIVDEALVDGPLPTPTPPVVELTPATASSTVGSVAGPVTVSATADGSALNPTLTVVGGQMYADSAGTLPIASGSTVDSGTQIYLRASDVGTVELRATALADVPGGSAYLYNGNVSGVTTAQSLTLATDAEVEVTASAFVTFASAPTSSTSVVPTSTPGPPTTAAPTSVAPTSAPPTSVTPVSTTTVPVDPNRRGRHGVAATGAMSRVDGVNGIIFAG